MSKQKIENIKSALIVVLIISACFFAYKTQLFTSAQQTQIVETPPPVDEVLPASYPDAIAVAGTFGGRYGAIYDGTEISTLWNLSSSTLGSALGTAEAPEEISEAEFRAVLNDTGIYYYYHYPVPVSVLIKWLNINAVRDHSEIADIIYLAPVDAENLTVIVYYRDGDGLFYKCSTSATMEYLVTEMNEILPNGAFYPFESDDTQSVNPYVLLPDTVPMMKTLVSSTLSVSSKDILEALGMNPFSHTNYRENDNCTVYVEEAILLKIYDDGHIELKSERPVAVIDNSLGGAIERARELVSAVTQSNSLQLVSYKSINSGFELKFNYYFNGIEIKQSSAATVTVTNGAATEAKILLRSYAEDDTEILLLPPRQAAAASGTSAGTLYIIYAETNGIYSPVWVKD